MSRATMLGPHDHFMLHQWGRQLREAFGNTAYLVGSTLRGGDWRDVDVRMVLPIPALHHDRDGAGLVAVNLGLTLWGRQVTGLPIDFQMQDATEFHEHDGEPRNPLGTTLSHRTTTALSAREANDAE